MLPFYGDLSQNEINPFFLLLLCRHKQRQKRLWWSADSTIQRKIETQRKELIGSDLGLTMFLRKDDAPNEEALDSLKEYLAARTLHFLILSNQQKKYDHEFEEELCEKFFYFCLWMYANNSIGDDSFDDLIKLANLLQKDKLVFEFVLEDSMPADIFREARDWLMNLDGERIPLEFERAVQGAVCVFTGTIYDPIEGEEHE